MDILTHWHWEQREGKWERGWSPEVTNRHVLFGVNRGLKNASNCSIWKQGDVINQRHSLSLKMDRSGPRP